MTTKEATLKSSAIARTEALHESLQQSLQGLDAKSDIRDLKSVTRPDTKSNIRVIETKIDIELANKLCGLEKEMIALRRTVVCGYSIQCSITIMVGIFVKFF